jgi:hypothetical protein
VQPLVFVVGGVREQLVSESIPSVERLSRGRLHVLANLVVLVLLETERVALSPVRPAVRVVPEPLDHPAQPAAKAVGEPMGCVGHREVGVLRRSAQTLREKLTHRRIRPQTLRIADVGGRDTRPPATQDEFERCLVLRRPTEGGPADAAWFA